MKIVCTDPGIGLTKGRKYPIVMRWFGVSGTEYYGVINDYSVFKSYHAGCFQIVDYVVDLL